ncbi:HipA domain-containing protein [Flavobacterium sp. UBA6046]|uniref:HipA domain-containing protein n=1 Tax=Flavobacterium sp. UBA6046 TaxID=1946552 RepID=UPI0032E4E6C0
MSVPPAFRNCWLSCEATFIRISTLRLDYPQAGQLYRRMVFNVLARSCDDHTKNFAFTMNKNEQWELSPAYDVCHAYRPDSPWVSQQSLSVNGKRQGFKRQDLLEVARCRRKEGIQSFWQLALQDIRQE